MAGRVFAFLCCFYLAFAGREPPWADAHVTYDTTQALVNRGGLYIYTPGGSPWFYAIREGRKYGVFPLGNVVALVPSYLIYKGLSRVPKLPDDALFAWTSHLSSVFLMAGVGALLYVLCRRRGASEGWSVAIALASGAATLCFPYSRVAYSEALQSLALLWVVERSLTVARRPTTLGFGWLGVAAGVLCSSKLVYVLIFPAIIGYLATELYGRKQLWFALKRCWLGAVIFGEFAAIALWHNHMKTGSLWNSGYQIPHGIFSGDLISALYGFVFSTGKSLLLYAPPVIFGLLGIRAALKTHRAETLFILSVCLTVLLFNAKFRHWHADYCWGPRHLVALCPLLLLLSVPWLPDWVSRGRRLWRKAAVVSVVGAGFSVQLLGISLYWDHFIRVLIAVKDQTGAGGWFHENLAHGHYIPEFSPLLGQAWLLKHLATGDAELMRDAPWIHLFDGKVDLSDAWNRLRLDFWLFDWHNTTGGVHAAAWLILAVCLTGMALTAVRFRSR